MFLLDLSHKDNPKFT